MTLGSTILVILALGFVLALMGLALRMLRRYAGGMGTGAGQIPLAVVQRLALGPKQGIALVRIGERVLVVSMGEGGVRPLTELAPEECGAITAGAPAAVRALPAPDVKALIQRVMRSAAMIGLLVAGLGLASTAQAQANAPAARQAPAAAAADAETINRIDNAIPKMAPNIDLRVGDQAAGGLRLSGTVGIVVMMGLLTLLPTLILSMTSFTRILIVLHFLKQAIGTQTAPPGQLVGALALLLTGFVMAPTFSEVNRTALEPWMNNQLTQGEMLVTASKPFREFMLEETRERDIVTFLEMSQTPSVSSTDEIPLIVLVSAFITSELRTAFQIGFALFLPFIIIDIVVASVLMSMGMMMLPPAMISLPFKLLLFVLVDGWTLVVQGLVTSFH